MSNQWIHDALDMIAPHVAEYARRASHALPDTEIKRVADEDYKRSLKVWEELSAMLVESEPKSGVAE